jgi:hypothetical protein
MAFASLPPSTIALSKKPSPCPDAHLCCIQLLARQCCTEPAGWWTQSALNQLPQVLEQSAELHFRVSHAGRLGASAGSQGGERQNHRAHHPSDRHPRPSGGDSAVARADGRSAAGDPEQVLNTASVVAKRIARPNVGGVLLAQAQLWQGGARRADADYDLDEANGGRSRCVSLGVDPCPLAQTFCIPVCSRQRTVVW